MALNLDTRPLPANLETQRNLFYPLDFDTIDLLGSIGQTGLFDKWKDVPSPGPVDHDKLRLLSQVRDLNRYYPAGTGLKGYVEKAKKLIQEVNDNKVSAFQGFKAANPRERKETTVTIEKSADFKKYEDIGLPAIADSAFVLVAGNQSEPDRLGYKGINTGYLTDSLTGTSLLQVFCQHVKIFTDRARKERNNPSLVIPVAILVSEDTDNNIRRLLKENNNFGLNDAGQIEFLRQQSVPAVVDSDGHFTVGFWDPYNLTIAPHGSGDIHSLLYTSKVAEKWVKTMGKKFIVMLQDNNGFVFHALPAALGASVESKMAVNTIAFNRPAGDPAGAVVNLKKDNKEYTLHVDSATLGNLLGKGAKEPTLPASTNSVFPGSTNSMIFDAATYLQVINESKGVIPEHIKPTMKEDKKTLDQPVGLHTVVQDIIRVYPDAAAKKIGFTQFPRWLVYSPVGPVMKSAPPTWEIDGYLWAFNMMKEAGAKFTPSQVENVTFEGNTTAMPPKIIFSPRFAVSYGQWRSRFPTPANIEIANPSPSVPTTLVVDGDAVTIHSLKLTGALIIQAAEGAVVEVKDLTVDNEGWCFREFTADEKSKSTSWYHRGYLVDKCAGEVYVFDKKGSYTLSNDTKEQYILKNEKKDEMDEDQLKEALGLVKKDQKEKEEKKDEKTIAEEKHKALMKKRAKDPACNFVPKFLTA